MTKLIVTGMKGLVLWGMVALWLWASECDSENVKEQGNEVSDPFLQLKAEGDLIGSLRPFDLVEMWWSQGALPISI